MTTILILNAISLVTATGIGGLIVRRNRRRKAAVEVLYVTRD